MATVYRTINTSFWTDRKVRALSTDGKLLMLYLVTCPHAHVGGIYYLPEVTVLHEVGVSKRALDTLWHTLSKVGLAFRDPDAEVVWVTNMLRYQGSGAKIYSGVGKQLSNLHNSKLIKKFLQRYPEVLPYFKDRVSKGYQTQSEFGNPDMDMEQENDQEQENEKGAADAAEFVVMVPVEIDTTEVAEALDRWLAYKRKRRQPYTDSKHIETKLREFIPHGPAAFVAAVDSSIGNNWAGLFPPKEGRNGKPTQSSAGKTFDPKATCDFA